MFSQLGQKPGKKIAAAALSGRPGRAGAGRTLCLVSHADADTDADKTARGLAGEGWKVTLLDLAAGNSMPHEPRNGKKRERPYQHVKLAGTFAELNWYAPMQALCVYQWLKNRAFDCVLFQQGFGAGYFCVAAKALGLAFASTPLVARTDNPFAFQLENEGRTPSFASFRTDAETDYFERMTVAGADGLLLSDPHVLDWMQAAGWPLDKVHVGVLGGRGKPASEWLASLVKAPAKKATRAALPLISVCVSVSGNAKSLDELLTSLRDQSLEKFEVILIDNAGGAATDGVKKKFGPVFKNRGWSWIKDKNPDEIARRNAAAKKAKGSHLLFLDGDDSLTPDALEILSRCAGMNAADILVSVQGKHHNSDNTIGALARLPARTAGGAPLTVGWIYYGANLAISPCVNVIGDAGALFRKDVFRKLGGFRGKPGELYYGRNLLLRAANKDYRIGVVPEVLTLCRRDKNYRHVWNENKFRNELASLAVTVENVPPALRALFLPFIDRDAGQKRPLPVAGAARPQASKHHKPPAFLASDAPAGRIKVALCADDHYLTQAGVTIASILCSAKNPVDIFLVTDAKKERIRRLQSLAGHFGNKITVIAPDMGYRKNIPASTMWGKASEATYWRLRLADGLPDLGRILYLDCDLIVRRDLAEIWSAPLGGNVLAAARDAFAFETGTMAADFGGDYFNAGVMLIDLAEWRKQDIGRKVTEAAATLKAENYPFLFHDQSPLNKAVNGNWTVLPPAWNYYDGIEAHAHHLDLGAEELAHLRTEAPICHFRAARKPWQPDFDGNSIYAREYRVYLAMVEALMRGELSA